MLAKHHWTASLAPYVSYMGLQLRSSNFRSCTHFVFVVLGMEPRTLQMLSCIPSPEVQRLFIILCTCCFQEMEVPLEKKIHPGNSELSFSTSATHSDMLCSSPFLSPSSPVPPALSFSEDIFISIRVFLGPLSASNSTEFASTGSFPGAGRNPDWINSSRCAIARVSECHPG